MIGEFYPDINNVNYNWLHSLRKPPKIKTIQYLLPTDYNKDKIDKVINLLFSNLVDISKKIKDKQQFNEKDFTIWPVSEIHIFKYRKIIITGKDTGTPLLEALDELFLENLKKEGLRVYRQEYIK